MLKMKLNTTVYKHRTTTKTSALTEIRWDQAEDADTTLFEFRNMIKLCLSYSQSLQDQSLLWLIWLPICMQHKPAWHWVIYWQADEHACRFNVRSQINACSTNELHNICLRNEIAESNFLYNIHYSERLRHIPPIIPQDYIRSDPKSYSSHDKLHHRCSISLGTWRRIVQTNSHNSNYELLLGNPSGTA